MKFKIFFAILLYSTVTGCAPFFQLINYSPSSKVKEISYTNDPANPAYKFYFPDTLNNTYLRELRNKYGLATITQDAKSKLDKVKIILDWTSRRWEHNGSNNPSNPDPLTILKEAEEGKNFRCVEYGIVSSSALNSIGIPSRVIGLKTRDVEKVRRGAGHVVAEVYVDELQKWVFIDAQFNVMPILNEIPLNAVEFQKAIAEKNKELKLVNLEGEVPDKQKESYLHFVGKHLYYIDMLFDQRVGKEIKYALVNGKNRITLIPEGAKKPEIFQRSYKMDYGHFTSSLNDFYKEPTK